MDVLLTLKSHLKQLEEMTRLNSKQLERLQEEQLATAKLHNAVQVPVIAGPAALARARAVVRSYSSSNLPVEQSTNRLSLPHKKDGIERNGRKSSADREVLVRGQSSRGGAGEISYKI